MQNQRLNLAFDIPYEELQPSKKLDKGSIGQVWFGWWNRREVAIKKFRSPYISSQEIADQFEQEVDVLKELNTKESSQHIILFHGTSIDNGTCYIIMEYMSSGSLFNVLHNRTLLWPPRMQIALDIAQGLSFLHEMGVVHCDLKSKNVLLDNEMRAKLSDFGLSIVVPGNGKELKKKLRGTLPWMAPEVLSSPFLYSKCTDIYSYGMVLWEIISCQKPYEHKGFQSEAELKDFVKNGGREVIPEACPQGIAGLINLCWNQRSDKRPDLDTIKYVLQSHCTTASSLIDFVEIATPVASANPETDPHTSSDDDNTSPFLFNCSVM